MITDKMVEAALHQWRFGNATSQFDAMRAALEAADAAAWETIDTAPKDGTKILGYWPGGLVSPTRWDDDRYRENYVPFWTHPYAGKLRARHEPPTHWRRLPAGPKKG